MTDDYFLGKVPGFRFDMRGGLVGGPVMSCDAETKRWQAAHRVDDRDWVGTGDTAVAAVLDLVAQRTESFPPHRPRRGGDVETWIKGKRDAYGDIDSIDAANWDARARWEVLDDLLENYRLHADTGVPLDSSEPMGPGE